MRGVAAGLAVALSWLPAGARGEGDGEPALARIPFMEDAGLAIDLALMATAAGRMELARAAANRALELAPGELDAHVARALVHQAAGETDLARAQAGACRAALAGAAETCAAIERALASSEPAGKLALDAAIARRAAARAADGTAAVEPESSGPSDDEADFEKRMEEMVRAAAEACVEVSRWNQIMVRVEVGDVAGPPHRVDVFTWETGDEDLRECVAAALSRAELPARPSSSAGLSGRVATVDFEATGRFRPRWFWRIRPTVLVLGLLDSEGDRALAAVRGSMALFDRPFLQPTAHLDGEIGSTHDGREAELVGRLGLGFARDPFAGGLTAGAGVSKIGDSAPAALVVPVELWLDYRVSGAGLLFWARNTFSPAEERRAGAEHATLDATALQLGGGLRIPALWRGGLLLGVRYDERLGEQRLAVWLGTEWRAARF